MTNHFLKFITKKGIAEQRRRWRVISDNKSSIYKRYFNAEGKAVTVTGDTYALYDTCTRSVYIIDARGKMRLEVGATIYGYLVSISDNVDGDFIVYGTEMFWCADVVQVLTLSDWEES